MPGKIRYYKTTLRKSSDRALFGALAYGYLGQIQETKERLQRALQLRPDWEAVARQEPLLKAHLPSS